MKSHLKISIAPKTVMLLMLCLSAFFSIAENEAQATEPHMQASFIGGKTYVPLNIGEVSYSELGLQNHHFFLADSSMYNLRLQTEFAFGNVITEAGNGNVLSIGPRLQAELFSNFQIAAAFRFSYLDKYIYKLDQGRTVKNYGGPRQFQYYGELLYQTSKNMSVGYRWQHMSNGMQVLPEPMKYPHNPVINTHNLSLQWTF